MRSRTRHIGEEIMVKLRDLVEANKKEGDVLLSNTPQKLTTEIKKKVFKDSLPIDVLDDS